MNKQIEKKRQKSCGKSSPPKIFRSFTLKELEHTRDSYKWLYIVNLFHRLQIKTE